MQIGADCYITKFISTFMFPFLQQPARNGAEQKALLPTRLVLVFEFGLFRDKDEGTTCREGFQKRPTL